MAASASVVGDVSRQDAECAICLEPTALSETLPCSCKVCYCAACWDKALACSFRDQGQARCPTCRGPVRVDFDPSTCRLVFSREAEDDSGDEADKQGTSSPTRQSVEDTITRIAGQARPAQVKILERYGASNGEGLRPCFSAPVEQCRSLSISALKAHMADLGLSPEGCLEKSDLVKRLKGGVSDQKDLFAWLASIKSSAPPHCVCGSALKRVSGRIRTEKMVKSMFPNASEGTPEFARAIESLYDQTGGACICDLCDEGLPRGMGVWTCENGTSTVLHATDYDVCDTCFTKHVPVGFEVDPAGSGVEEAQRLLNFISRGEAEGKRAASTSVEPEVTVEDPAGRTVTCPLCQQKFLARSEDECTSHMASCTGFALRHGIS